MINLLVIVLEQALLHLPFIIGSYISFSLLKVPDLSIESAYVCGAVMASRVLVCMPHLSIASSLFLVLVAAMIGGVIVGFISSLLTQYGRFPHLLSSIVATGLFQGINLYLSPVYLSLAPFNNPLACCNLIQYHPELCMVGIVSLMIVLGISLLLATQLGYSFGVYGNNPQFFNHYGISTPFVFITGIVIANGLGGLSGYLFAQSNNFVELGMGTGKSLLGLSALILGKGIIRSGSSYSLRVPLVGTGIYFLMQQLLLKIGFDLKYFTAVQALIILCILFYSYRSRSRRFPHSSMGV